MERSLKQRLVGATVLVALAVIFLPMLLRGPEEASFTDSTAVIPPEPRSRHAAPSPPAAPPTEVAEAPAPPSPPAEAAPAPAPAETPESGPEPAPPEPESEGAESGESRAAEPARSLPRTPPPEALTTWVVQLASFSERANADKLRDRLRRMGHTAFVEGPRDHGGRMFRVRVGPLMSADEAQRLKRKFREEMSLKGLIIRHQGGGGR